jgi:pimeloyl-ACP methyl ester carboxylesterase
MTPLLFLPGAGGRAAFWQPVATRLADLGPAQRLGWPGFGGEPADPTIRSLDDLYGWLLRRLPAEPVALVAQSMGGVLAARLAIEHPARVARLVLVATSGGVDVSGLGGADWRAEYRATLPDVPDWFVTDRTDLTVRLREIAAPTLLLWSDADPVSPLAVSELLLARIPGSRRQVIRGGTHAFAEERAEEVAARLREFLTTPIPFEVWTDALGVARHLHGTKADLKPGDLIEAGRSSNYGERRSAAWVYFTATLDAATWGAELALGDGPGRIYLVEPTGPYEDDPNLTNQKFPGNPTRSYRTRAPLRVTGELTGWRGHAPEQLQAMKDGLARLAAQGIDAIEE